jgi:hypothetical protein
MSRAEFHFQPRAPSALDRTAWPIPGAPLRYTSGYLLPLTPVFTDDRLRSPVIRSSGHFVVRDPDVNHIRDQRRYLAAIQQVRIGYDF